MYGLATLLTDTATIAALIILGKGAVRTLRSRMQAGRAGARAKACACGQDGKAGRRPPRDERRAGGSPGQGGLRLACSLFLGTRTFTAALRLKIRSASSQDAGWGA